MTHPDLFHQQSVKMDSALQNRRYVIGMGASAGGLDALTQLIADLPTQSDSIFVIAQHMSASHRSMMAEILSRQTQLPVQEIVADEIPLPNVIYIVPTGSNLEFLEGRLHLCTPDTEVAPKPSINLLFQSMAKEFDTRAIGIVLSGTGSDGTLGLRAIKEAGGMTFVQSPETAKYDGMPRSAIEAGVADYVAPPDEICHVLDHLLRLPTDASYLNKQEEHRDTFADLLERVRLHTQIDFSNYKPATVQRRLQRRMNTTRTFTLEAYLAYIDTHPNELDALAKDALISVTEFFRDAEAFQALKHHLYEIVQQKQPDEELRIWVVGCASGEEAYSLAMMCLDLITESRKPLHLLVFATDIDNDALTVARHGVYSQAALVDVPDSYTNRYFQPHHNGFEVTKALRDCVVFSHQDIAVDPSFPKIDLVSCRNVLIYFNNDLQAKVLAIVHRCLLDNGLVFLGLAETINQQETLFSTVDHQAKIFRSRGVVTSAYSSKLVRGQLKRPTEGLHAFATMHETVFMNALADRVGPVMLVDVNFKILHTHGEVAQFITFPSGTPELNLLHLIVPEFAHEVTTTLYRAQRLKVSAYSRQLCIASLDQAVWRLAIHPLVSSAGNDLFLVVFEKINQPTEDIQQEQQDKNNERKMDAEHALAHELALARERLQTMAEDLSAFKEEMSALTEELQTSNEELQATNEELLSANDESQIKSSELAMVNSDFESLFNTVDFPVLLLDKQLILKRANSAAMRSYDLSMASAGQPVTRLNLPRHLRNIGNHLKAAIANAVKQNFATEFEGRTYQIFVTPVLHHPNSVQGAVLVVIDNTDLTMAQQHICDSQERLLSIMNHSMSLISVKDAAGCYEFVNHRFETLLGVKADDVMGKTDHEVFGTELGQQIRSNDLEVMLKLIAVESTDVIALDGGTLWLDSIRFPIFDTSGNLRSVCTQSNDVTYRHQADQQLRLASKVFERAGEAIMVTDTQSCILSINDAFTRITAYSADEVIGKTPNLLKSGQNPPLFYQTMWRCLLDQGFWLSLIHI